MASAKRDIRQIIDSFSDDLILIAQDIARERVERAVLEWQAKNEKLLAKKLVQDEKAQRLQEKALKNQKALERIERVAEKRRAREEKKAAERALRLEQRMIADSTEKPEKKPGRGRKSGGLLGDSAAKKEPTPPPLFVHKRRRDGEIQQLKRGDDETTLPAAAPANGANSNGAPAPAIASGVGEQLRLGL
ncbi:MAG TPA: hypothetical protein VGC79_15140 [Polyangiaceae bacterium]